jgi:soluble lytic murein transglycosylase
MTASGRRVPAPPLLLALAIGLIAAACSGSSDKPTPTPLAPSATPGAPAATPTATPAPPDPALGAALRYEGDFDGAIGVYGAIAASTAGDARQQARFAQAQLLVRTNRQAEAQPVLEAWLADAGGGADGSEAQYMLASVLDDLGDAQGALTAYERYIAANGVLIEFARIERAKLLARLNRVPEAVAAADEVRASTTLLPVFRDSFTFSFASALDRAGDDLAAIEWYDRARIEGGDAASALARTGAIKKRLGDASWSSDELLAITAYPESGVASDLLDELDAASIPVGDYVRGVVDYRAGRDDAARAALTRAADAGDHAAQATYYLAAIDEREGDTDAAIAGYRRAHDLDPTMPLAADALWWGGRLLEAAGRYDEAGAAYAALIEGYSSSKWYSDAAFKHGLVLYRAGNYAAAAFSWAALVPSLSGDAEARARYWEGRALSAQQDQLASVVLGQLVADDPGNYYALRAEVLLGRNDTSSGDLSLTPSPVDWSAIATYVFGRTAVASVDALTARIAADPRWDVAAALEDVGLHAQSDAEYRSMFDGGVAELYYAVRRLYGEGRTSLASRAAALLIDRTSNPVGPPPDGLLRVAYPLAYADLLTAAAKEQEVSPLLLLALVRQESFYDPQAGSPAGALGLTQVIPSTGGAIATALGVEPFTATDLYRPKISLRFGASYLSDQMGSFDGDVYRALAAYNGGPGAAAIAATSAGNDEDLFVEDLEFDETRLYIRRVMENYARYRQLYQGVGRPSLPR